MMSRDDAAELRRVREVQGFDAKTPSARDTYVILGWIEGKVRRKYSIDVIFDGAREGLQEILSRMGAPAVCIGRGSVSVGVDDTVPSLFSRRVNVGIADMSDFIRPSRSVIPLSASSKAPSQEFGPFSLKQQLYAADMIDFAGVTLYGVRARWAASDEWAQETYFVLQAASLEEVLALLQRHFDAAHPDVARSRIFLDIDDSRLETVASGWSLFSTSQFSSLDEVSFIEKHRLR